MDDRKRDYPLFDGMTVQQAREACRLAGEVAAIRAVRACAQWFRVHTAYGVTEEAISEMERDMLVDVVRAYCVTREQETKHHG